MMNTCSLHKHCSEWISETCLWLGDDAGDIELRYQETADCQEEYHVVDLSKAANPETRCFGYLENKTLHASQF